MGFTNKHIFLNVLLQQKYIHNKTLFFLLYAMNYSIHLLLWQLMNFPWYFVSDSDLGKRWVTYSLINARQLFFSIKPNLACDFCDFTWIYLILTQNCSVLIFRTILGLDQANSGKNIEINKQSHVMFWFNRKKNMELSHIHLAVMIVEICFSFFWRPFSVSTDSQILTKTHYWILIYGRINLNKITDNIKVGDQILTRYQLLQYMNNYTFS